jgi:hypothetical protein
VRAALVAVLLLTAGCSSTAERSCFIGMSILPPLPIVICGVDFSKPKSEPSDVRETP